MNNSNRQRHGVTIKHPGIRSSGFLASLGTREGLWGISFSFLMILVFALLLYGHVLDVPFYLDDYSGIVDHYLLRDLSATLSRVFSPRGITNLTFAINYYFSGLSLPPLHLTNIAIHASCGCLVFLLLCHWFSQRWIPLLGALLFIAHPLQTQAVTYLVQRAASLATFFFLLTILLHLRARNALATGHSRNSRPYLIPHLSAAIVFALAVLSKQNTVTLPLLLIIHDRIFPQKIVRSRKEAVLDYLLYAAVPLLGVMEFVSAQSGAALHIPLASLRGNDPLHYLVTQFSVIWVYFRLLLFPYGQALEHNYPIVIRLLTVQNLLALAGLVSIIWLAWRLRNRRPLLTFGVTWFFLGLGIESSIIPLDPLFEHRLYLPMLGFLLILLDLLSVWFAPQWVHLLLVAAIMVCAFLTWQRNQLWKEPIAFYEDNQKHAPDSERVCLLLANLYKKSDRIADARRQFERIQQLIPPDSHPYHQEIILFYAEQGEYQKAWTLVEEGVRLRPQDPETYKSGALYWRQRQQPQAAMEFLQQGLAANPQNGKMYDLIGEHALDQGEMSRAEQAFRKSIKSGYGYDKASTYRNLSEALYNQGRMNEALEQLQIALLLAPGRPDIYEGMGRIAVALGDKAMVHWALDKLTRIDQESRKRLQQVIIDARLDGN